jgi:tetratricopeptide (TPR) repeat protein
MIECDYILRMISQLAAVMAKILFAKNAQNYAEALQIAQSSYEQLLGLNGELVERMDAATIAMLLGEKEKIKVLASLLQEEGDILLLQGRKPEGEAKYEKALALLQSPFTTGDADCQAAIAALQKRGVRHQL